MKRSRLPSYRLSISIVAIVGMQAPARAALLEGKQVLVTLAHRTEDSSPATSTSANVLVGPGVELPNFGAQENENPPIPPLYDVDLSDMQIRLTLLRDQPFFVGETFDFNDDLETIPPITRADINPATNWDGFNASRISLIGNEGLLVNVAELTGQAGQQILIDLNIPEPATTGLALTAFAALWARRKA